ncbi:calmodulin-interacting protein 111-like isoform X1 [Musa acuminata AAA Group]|uniref:calmodulin-interacting protein 111-like isoform X1 n=1 Tax=Musa acuminata AAA Group TaxID=214697 RepID=UPI0031D48EFC
MPPKGKKPARASLPVAMASPSDRSPLFPGTPMDPSRGSPAGDDDEAVHRRLLAAAAAKFPALISEDRTFCGRITETESSPSNGSHARVWLSSAAMISTSIAPGSIVSVSFPASGKAYLNNFPLNTLAEECAPHFGSDVDGYMANRPGSYFAIASVFPSLKVLKDGVRLSWGLSCTIGSPDLGRAVFICPIEKFSIPHSLNNSDSVAPSCLCQCKDLYLNLVVSKAGLNSCNKEQSTSNSGLSSLCLLTRNGEVASPQTPSHQRKLATTADSPMYLRKSHNLLPTLDSSSCLDVSFLKLALADEKIKELLQIYSGRWLCGRHLLKGNSVSVPICGQICTFLVEGADMLLAGKELDSEKTVLQPDEILISRPLDQLDAVIIVNTTTKVHLSDSTSSKQESSNEVGFMNEQERSKVVFDKESVPKLGGLSKEFAALKEIILFSLDDQDSLPRYKGVLLHGPPGTGKTSLATSCARSVGASLFSINGPEVISEYYGESEQALREVFDSAKQAAPSVVFIDELDAIAPTRKEGSEELSLRIVATLLKLMDEINIKDRVLVIATTNRPDSIDPALRRPGRLDREIEIGVPSPEHRLDILCTLLNEIVHSLSIKEIQSLALGTHGFVGADLSALCNEAAMTALRRYIGHTCDPGLRKDEGVQTADPVDSLSSSLFALNMSSEQVASISATRHLESSGASQRGSYESQKVESEMLLKVTIEDFEKAKMKVRPSAMREVMLELPKVRWEDVGGQSMIKRQLIEAVQWPQICPDAFIRLGIRPPRGLLMIGPPGCSKTLMARAVASEAKLNFLAVKGPELFSKWVGESEKAVRSLFAKARANSPAIVFFDEIDGLAVTRGQDSDGTSVADRVLSQLLVEMDGLDQKIGVTVIAATNRPDKIDPALLRPGRFDRLLDVQPPDENDREDIFRIHMRNMPCSSDVSINDLAQLTEGYTGADIKLICREAALAALEESLEISEVSMVHFKFGISRVQPSDLKFYRELAAQFRRLVDNQSARGE